MKQITKKRQSILCIIVILLCSISLCCGLIVKRTSASAESIEPYSVSDHAAIKGFTVNNYGYGTEWYKDAKMIGDNYGSMSLWIARYVKTDPDNPKGKYVTFLIEAKISSAGKVGTSYYNNNLMDIEVTRVRDCSTTILTYAPVQSDSQYTVTESFNIGGSVGTDSSKASFGYSYQTSKVYSCINYISQTVSSESNDEYNRNPTISKYFKYNFSNSFSDRSGTSPYAGEIIQKMSLTFYVDYSGSYADTDFDTYVVKYNAAITKDSSKKTGTLGVKFVSGIAKDL